MNGFELQLKQRILGIMPHIVIDVAEPSQQLSEVLQALPQVKSYTHFIETEAIVQSNSGLKGIVLQGIDSEQSQAFEEIDGQAEVGQFSQDEVQEEDVENENV